MEIFLFNKFMLPNIGIYDDTKDSLEHLKKFKSWIDLYAYIDMVRCWAFPLTLKDKAKAWYYTFKPNIMSSF